MNNLEFQIIDELKMLKEYYGIYAIKAEFEAEGARMDELIRLREIVLKADLNFIIKIGGCEAIHDLNQCKLLGATGIMAPMIETPFALSKFKSAANRVYGENIKDIEWIINAETKTCLFNYDEILKENNNFLNAITVGRSDLSASMGIERNNIESIDVFNATTEFLKKSKQIGLTTNFGGNIGVESIPFIIKMSNIANRFETRKVVISLNNNNETFLKDTIQKALKFELDYLLYKQNYYLQVSNEDNARILRMKKQLGL